MEKGWRTPAKRALLERTALQYQSASRSHKQRGIEPLEAAIRHVNEAHALFAQERYREAVQLCRQARDSLVTDPKPMWAARFLSPIIGTEKANLMDENIRALNHLGHAASHGTPSAPRVEIDRDVASTWKQRNIHDRMGGRNMFGERRNLCGQ